jgi:small subunit ribosomal protein S11
MAKRTSRRKKKKLTSDAVVAHIHATYNNTIVTVSDKNGNTICWASGGTSGYQGSRKGTPYAAQLASNQAAKTIMDYGARTAEIYVRGTGAGKEAAIRALQASGLEITSVRDITPVPHNGCRPKKKRRM